jgi:hypothetical protein
METPPKSDLTDVGINGRAIVGRTRIALSLA